MEDGTYDLAATDWVGTPVAVPLEHDRRAVVSLDHRAEVRTKRSVIPPPRIVRTTETPADASFTAAYRRAAGVTVATTLEAAGLS